MLSETLGDVILLSVLMTLQWCLTCLMLLWVLWLGLHWFCRSIWEDRSPRIHSLCWGNQTKEVKCCPLMLALASTKEREEVNDYGAPTVSFHRAYIISIFPNDHTEVGIFPLFFGWGWWGSVSYISQVYLLMWNKTGSLSPNYFTFLSLFLSLFFFVLLLYIKRLKMWTTETIYRNRIILSFKLSISIRHLLPEYQ